GGTRSANRSRFRSRSCWSTGSSRRNAGAPSLNGASEPFPIVPSANFRDVIVPGAVDDEQVALVGSRGKHFAAHAYRDDDVAVAMRHPDRRPQRTNALDGIEVDP